MDVADDVPMGLRRWLSDQDVIARTWIFGLRAKRMSRPDSDLDLGVELIVTGTKALLIWMERSTRWRVELAERFGDSRIDFHHVDPAEDIVVWPAIRDHGILIFERGSAASDRSQDGPTARP